MDSNEEITWIVTSNTVKDRMIDSSLIHRFSNSRKYQKRTKLLNDLIKRYRNQNKYNLYVKMKQVVNQRICVDKETDNEDSSIEEYSKSSKKNVSLMSNSACSDENVNISLEKKLKHKTLKIKDESLSPNASNQILSTDLKSHKKNRKRLRTLQVNDANEDEVPVKKKSLIHSPKQCLKKIDKTNLIHNEKNSSNSLNATDNALLETSISHTKAIVHSKCNNMLACNIEDNKEVDNCTSKSKTMKNLTTEINIHRNHLLSPSKCLAKEKLHLDLIDDIKTKILDHSEMSEETQQVVSHNANEVLPKVENTSFDIEENEIVIKQENLTYTSDEAHNSMNLCNTINKKLNNDLSLPNIDILHKSPPTVKSTEIISKKYKIMNKRKLSDELPAEFNTSTPLKLSQYCPNQEEEEEEEELEKEEYANSLNSSLSITEKRLKQLKNLNLTLESTSSSSEDEIPQTKDQSNESLMLSKSHCVTPTNKITWSKFKLNRSYNTDHVNNRNVLGTQRNPTHNNNIDQDDNYNKTLNKHNSSFSKNIVPKVETLIERPCNLKNFIKEENLIQDTTESTFVLQDLSRHEDMFLVDIPITAQLAHWQGQRIVLKKKNLKVGKNKYKITYKDIPAQSCVFNICKDSKQYKMVNIKPKGSVIVKRKLLPLFVPNYKSNKKTV